DALTVAVEELRDRRRVVERGEQLDARAGVADAHHRLAHPLLLVDLLVRELHPVGVAVEGDGLVEVGHGDTDVVDGGEEISHASQPMDAPPGRGGRRPVRPDTAVVGTTITGSALPSCTSLG